MYGYEYDADCGRQLSFTETVKEFFGILLVWCVMKIAGEA